MPDPRDHDRRDIRPAEYPSTGDYSSPYLRRDVFDVEHRRLEDRLRYIENAFKEHDREHDEEAKWRRRMLYTSIISPVFVGIVLAIVAVLIAAGRGP